MDLNVSCPVPITNYDQVTMAHGGGGSLSNQLIEKMFLPELSNPLLNEGHDGAIFDLPGKLAFSTDSFVVNPIFFPGGDIGDLAVNGTVNDLVCCGAVPRYLSLGMIIEEGFSMEELWQIVQSIGKAAKIAGVQVVTGDTKVVDKGKGDKIFINTSGIGHIPANINIGPKRAQAGDVVIINGKIAEHGVAIMSSREGLEFETSIISDTMPLNDLMNEVYSVTREVHVLRDPTRGGISSALNEIAKTANVGIEINEKDIPISEQVKGACEILGLDPLYIANEGKILIIVPEEYSEQILETMRRHPAGRDSSIIGSVSSEMKRMVRMKTSIGSTRIVDMISGEQLPRIC
ncbi:MAG: hydrogenase expression/formation protein HypE [Bacteroidales bacterium]|nr:hydrogenase expression/formation protein HypE [Bacteroidales bacterium]